VDDTDPGADSDLRRRAGWLLAMLAVVAVLFVVVMTTLIGTDKGGDANSTPGALDSVATSQPASARPSSTHHTKPSTTPSTTASHTSSTSAAPPTGTTSCPTKETCILEGDLGNGVAAINDYRTQHGLPAVPGDVSTQAQTCAVHNGSGCSGGWAETELEKPDGAKAVQKILPFAHLTDSHLKSIEVGWAYDPSAKLYYFAIIRND
jgi:hypothetical protein